MTWIKNNWLRIIFYGLSIFVALLIYRQCTGIEKREEPELTNVVKLDSIDKKFVLPKVTPNVPVKEKKIYKKKDIVLRKEAEKKDIIINEVIKPHEVDITKIDTAGVITTEILAIPEDPKEIVVDQTGQVQVKEKTKVGKWLKKAKKNIVNGLAVTGAVAVVLAALFLTGTI